MWVLDNVTSKEKVRLALNALPIARVTIDKEKGTTKEFIGLLLSDFEKVIVLDSMASGVCFGTEIDLRGRMTSIVTLDSAALVLNAESVIKGLG